MTARSLRAATALLTAGALVGLAACADAPSAPAAPHAAPRLSTGSVVNTTVISQAVVGDTTVTVFLLGTNTSNGGVTVAIGNSNHILFPYQVGSVCDPATSSYGPTEWDKACTPAKTSIQITAKSWTAANGLPKTDFQPALRFVPGLKKNVMLSLRDKTGTGWGARVDFCENVGRCINEAAADPSVATVYNATNGFWERRVKHFSGYNVVFGTDGDGSANQQW